MYHLTTDHLLALLANHEPPCISLYQPTHRHHPDNQQAFDLAMPRGPDTRKE